MKVIKSTKLFFQEGSSDKVYDAEIVEVEAEVYTVKVQWGRRGAASLNQGTKAVKVSLAAAEAAFNKVVRQKTKKGYEEVSEAVQPAEVAPPVGEGSGSKAGVGGRAKLAQAAQLLNTIDDKRLEKLLADDDHVAQQKFDGMRLLIHIDAEGAIVGTNRGGEITSVPQQVLDAVEKLPPETILDGELMASGELWLFDLLCNDGEDLREDDYEQRYGWLCELDPLSELLRIVPMASSEAQKRALFAQLQQQHAEGIVFKRADAAYKAGRPASGGAQLKYKFVKSADVLITANAGNAYRMAVHDAKGKLRDVGKVFAGTTNKTRKQLDELISGGEQPVAEVNYLYATDADVLYQPVFVRLRDDKPAAECDIGQLIHTNRDVVANVEPH